MKKTNLKNYTIRSNLKTIPTDAAPKSNVKVWMYIDREPRITFEAFLVLALRNFFPLRPPRRGNKFRIVRAISEDVSRYAVKLAKPLRDSSSLEI